MKQTWIGRDGEEWTADVPSILVPVIEAIGVDLAFELAFNLGGAPVYIPEKPREGTILGDVIGVEASAKLGRAIKPGHFNVPNAVGFCIRYLASRGEGTNEIARKMKRGKVTVRFYLAHDEDRAAESLRAREAFRERSAKSSPAETSTAEDFL